MSEKYHNKRTYQTLVKRLDLSLLEPAFENWLSAERDNIKGHFQDVFEIGMANRERIAYDYPSEFALAFMRELVEDIVLRRENNLASNLFLESFLFENNSSQKKDVLALLRHVVHTALYFQLMDLLRQADVQLAKRGWAVLLSTPIQDASGDSEEKDAILNNKEEGNAVRTLKLGDLADAPDGMGVREVVAAIYEPLKQTLKEARSYAVQHQKEQNHDPSPLEITKEFPLLADATGADIDMYVTRHMKTPRMAALLIIQKISQIPEFETVKRYTRLMPRKK